MNDRDHKAFQVVAAEPDYAPINARDQVIEDNDLDIGARLMFVRILDLSTRPGDRDDYGVITISQNKLAHKFGVSLRTIWNWKQQLMSKGVIWMTKQFMPNAWPMDTYHITALDPQGQTEGRTTKDGMWGNGARRQSPDRMGLGARQPGQTIIPGTGVRSNQLRVATGFHDDKKSSFLPANATADRNELPATAETGCEPEPQPIATGSRNPLRLGAETGCEPEPKQVATVGRNPLRLSAETGCELKKSKAVGNSIPKVCATGASARSIAHTPLPKFEPLDPKTFQRIKQKDGPAMIERLKTRIGAMDQSRTPLPNQKEIIAVYRQRIRDIKNWMDGIVEPPQQKAAAGNRGANLKICRGHSRPRRNRNGN